MTFDVHKKEFHSHAQNRLARGHYHTSHAPPYPSHGRPELPGGISCLGPDKTGGGKSIAAIFTILGSSFHELWLFFCWTDGPRDYQAGSALVVKYMGTDLA